MVRLGKERTGSIFRSVYSLLIKMAFYPVRPQLGTVLKVHSPTATGSERIKSFRGLWRSSKLGMPCHTGRAKGLYIALVVTDIGMPVMDGYEMIGKLKKLKPELPIVIASGYHEFKIDTRMALDNVVAVIHKPFGADRLREVLKSTLAYSKSTAVYQGSLPLV